MKKVIIVFLMAVSSAVCAGDAPINNKLQTEANAIALNSQKEVFLLATTAVTNDRGLTDNAMFVVKYDVNLKQVWKTKIAECIDLSTKPKIIFSERHQSVFIEFSSCENGESRPSIGKHDVSFMKIDLKGNIKWQHVLGTPDQFSWESGIEEDSNGNIVLAYFETFKIKRNKYISSSFWKSNIVKFNVDSNYPKELWRNSISTTKAESDSIINSIKIDSSDDIYVAGYVSGPILPSFNQVGKVDGIIGKISKNGSDLWFRQFGEVGKELHGRRILVSKTHEVYVGFNNLTDGKMSISKYSGEGDFGWTKHEDAISGSVAISDMVFDPNENILLTGITTGNFDGVQQFGYSDYFITKYGPSGDSLFKHQFGASGRVNKSSAVILRDKNEFLVTGYTNGRLNSGQRTGERDLFLTKFDISGNKVLGVQGGLELK